jgi:hypothetical protein
MNSLEPVIAFIDERLKQISDERHYRTPGNDARIQELEMVKTLCKGLIEQDRLLNAAMGI